MSLLNILLIVAVVSVVILIILPYWMVSPGISKDSKVIKGVLPPGSRRYTFILPDSITNERPLPLIIGLHYGGHGFPYYGELFLREVVSPVFRSLNVILVAPDCPAEDWTQIESEHFIRDLITYLKEHYHIDNRKVLLMGYSMGGTGAWFLSGKKNNPFTAAVIMAARPPDLKTLDGWNLPMFIIHGKMDELFPVAGTTKAVVDLESDGVDLNYRILEGVSHFEVHRYHAVLEEVKTWLIDKWGM